MSKLPPVDVATMSPSEFASYVLDAAAGERMVYMRKPQGEYTPLKREALDLYEAGFILLTQRRCERPNEKLFEYIATRTKKPKTLAAQ